MGTRASRFWQRVNNYGNDETRDPFSHSNAYHRHFQGYAERLIPRKNGRGNRIERIYAADYIRYDETDTVWRRKKFAYIVLFALMAAASLFADSRPAAINRLPVAGILQLLSLIPLIYMLYKLILQVSAPRRMTAGERDSSVSGFRKASGIYGAAVLAVAAAMLIGKWIEFRAIEMSEWAVLGCKLLSGALAFLLYFMEKARKLERVPNEVSVPGEANEIW